VQRILSDVLKIAVLLILGAILAFVLILTFF
jgi:hypothetical protein